MTAVPDIRIVRLAGLPPAFAELARAAAAEGVGNMALLSAGFADASDGFDRAGEALFGAWAGARLIGAGGLTRERAPGVDAMRMRRFYVAPALRRYGAGRALAREVIAAGFQAAPLLTCNARASAAASPFWEALGFTPELRCGWTHVLRRGG